MLDIHPYAGSVRVRDLEHWQVGHPTDLHHGPSDQEHRVRVRLETGLDVLHGNMLAQHRLNVGEAVGVEDGALPERMARQVAFAWMYEHISCIDRCEAMGSRHG